MGQSSYTKVSLVLATIQRLLQWARHIYISAKILRKDPTLRLIS